MKENADKGLVGMFAYASMPLMLLTAAAFLPMAAFGLELREYAKVGLSYALPTVEGSFKYFRTDQMDYGTYFNELFGRAGLEGAFGILTMAQRSGDWGGSAIATLMGPTAEFGEQFLSDFPNIPASMANRLNSPSEQVGAIMGVAAFTPLIARKFGPLGTLKMPARNLGGAQ